MVLNFYDILPPLGICERAMFCFKMSIFILCWKFYPLPVFKLRNSFKCTKEQFPFKTISKKLLGSTCAKKFANYCSRRKRLAMTFSRPRIFGADFLSPVHRVNN